MLVSCSNFIHWGSRGASDALKNVKNVDEEGVHFKHAFLRHPSVNGCGGITTIDKE